MSWAGQISGTVRGTSFDGQLKFSGNGPADGTVCTGTVERGRTCLRVDDDLDPSSTGVVGGFAVRLRCPSASRSMFSINGNGRQREVGDRLVICCRFEIARC